MTDVLAASELQGHLRRDETVLWAGRPGRGIRFRSSDWLLVPFSLLWGGFAIFWESTAIAQGGISLFALWGIPFVLVGLYLIFGRFFWDAWVRAGQTYGVTGSRLIVKNNFPSASIQTFDLHNMPSLTLSENADRSGTIYFEGSGLNGFHSHRGWAPSQASSGFEFIDNARDVYGVIIDAQNRHDP